jgi:hypothetical protein
MLLQKPRKETRRKVGLGALYRRKESWNMPRKVRSDKTVGKVERDLGLSTGAIRNEDGRDTRSDKKLGTIRKEQSKQNK